MITLPTQINAAIDQGALFVINHSAGKDSQAMTLALAGLGIPSENILVVHAELPGVDWPGLREHIEATIPQDWKLEYTRAGKTFFDMVERRIETRPDSPCWPSPQYRQCTSDLKRDPINKVIRRYLKENPRFGGLVINCTGIRAEESSSRAKQNPLKLNKRESKAGRQVWDWMPIFDFSESQVFNAIREAGQDVHSAYHAGMSRLSCCFCIMASKKDLQTAARLRPELAAKYVEIEERTGYTMSMQRIPLSEIIG